MERPVRNYSAKFIFRECPDKSRPIENDLSFGKIQLIITKKNSFKSFGANILKETDVISTTISVIITKVMTIIYQHQQNHSEGKDQNQRIHQNLMKKMSKI